MIASGSSATPSKAAFISHSSEQSTFALALCAALEARGVHCWIAPRDVSPGRSYADACSHGIEDSRAFVLLASASAISSVQVMSEVEQAHKRRKPIYTILIGKPRVSRELDYYISRLHWLEAHDNVDVVAEQLTGVLSDRKSWHDVAAPPSLKRTVLHRRDAFVGSLAATVLTLAVTGLALGYWVQYRLGSLDQDFRRLGHVTLSASITDGEPSLHLQGHIWLFAPGVRFNDVSLLAHFRSIDGRADQVDYSRLLSDDQVGGVRPVEFSAPIKTTRFAVCLSIPDGSAGGARSRVTQDFGVPTTPQGQAGMVFALSALSEPRVTTDDGTDCGSETR